MKLRIPGTEPFRMQHRTDGWVGGIGDMPTGIARIIAAESPSSRRRTVAEATRARMIARMLDLDMARRVSKIRKKRFGLETRKFTCRW
jgi:hypothetical protein